MDERDGAYLFDILDAIEGVFEHMKPVTSFEDFISKRTTYRAVEREFEIISEAISKLSKTELRKQLDPQGKIKGMRNRIVHAYDNINYDIIWSVIKKGYLLDLKVKLNF
jgi:uncharacterized protein with HEPN domain